MKLLCGSTFLALVAVVVAGIVVCVVLLYVWRGAQGLIYELHDITLCSYIVNVWMLHIKIFR